MKIVTGRHGQTIISSTSFQLYDKINHENGIYDKDLSDREKTLVFELITAGVINRVNDNGQTKYLTYSKK
jgi:hypothetical protein